MLGGLGNANVWEINSDPASWPGEHKIHPASQGCRPGKTGVGYSEGRSHPGRPLRIHPIFASCKWAKDTKRWELACSTPTSPS